MAKSDGKLHENKKGGRPLGRIALFNMISAHGKEIIDFHLSTMRNEKVPISVRQSAANKLIDKILPNLQAQALQDDEGNTIQINVIQTAVKHNLESAPETTGSTGEN